MLVWVSGGFFAKYAVGRQNLTLQASHSLPPAYFEKETVGTTSSPFERTVSMDFAQRIASPLNVDFLISSIKPWISFTWLSVKIFMRQTAPRTLRSIASCCVLLEICHGAYLCICTCIAFCRFWRGSRLSCISPSKASPLCLHLPQERRLGSELQASSKVSLLS